MEPKFKVGDRVDHKTVTCKRNGEIKEVFNRTVYVLYAVHFPHCSGDFYETELAPASKQESGESREASPKWKVN